MTSPKPRKVGRPRIEDAGKTITARKPWVKAGMSRATWYARQKEKREKAAAPPVE